MVGIGMRFARTLSAALSSRSPRFHCGHREPIHRPPMNEQIGVSVKRVLNPKPQALNPKPKLTVDPPIFSKT